MDDFSQTLMRNRKSASGPLFLVCLRYRDLHIHSVLSGRHRQLYTEYLQDLRIQNVSVWKVLCAVRPTPAPVHTTLTRLTHSECVSLESIVCCPAHTGS